MSFCDVSCDLPLVRNELIFEDTETRGTVVCRGEGTIFYFRYYKNGRQVSRRALKLPRLKPCEPRPFKGCVRWFFNRPIGRWQSLVYDGQYFEFGPYTLPPNVIPEVIRAKGYGPQYPPKCFSDRPRPHEVDTIYQIIAFKASYEKHNPQKGQHDLLIECECPSEFVVSSYSSLIDLKNDIEEACSSCEECIDWYIFEMGLEQAVAQIEVECRRILTELAIPVTAACGYAHRTDVSLNEMALSGRARRCTPE